MRKDSLIPSLLGNPTDSNKPGTALAGTFDPNLLAKGFAADVVMARFWYERAKQFGSTEAPRRLEQLESSVKSAP